MVEKTSIIIDNDLILDVDTGIIGSKKTNVDNNSENSIFPINEIMSELDKLESSINDLETSLDPRTTSNLSEKGREGVYEKAGLLTNVVIGVIIALVIIILLL